MRSHLYSHILEIGPYMGANRLKVGPVMEKVLLLIAGGFALSLTRRPDTYFRIVNGLHKEWKNINQRALRDAIRKLYSSQLVRCKETSDGVIQMVLSVNGKKRVLRQKFDLMIIPKTRWDRLWRMVIFDIPESKKVNRQILVRKLRALGFYPLQRSVFVYPYECKNEVDFLIEFFDLRRFVRFVVVKEIDNELHLKDIFNLL